MEISYDFYKGFKSVFDFDITPKKHKFKTNGNYSKEDYLALKEDWENVGRDIRGSIKEYRSANKQYK